jgi:5-oxopent-3-ene-1,2,5-tricarboxylate decarboxylase / 2-hydroxyhepta-2,4-diene-1,7-dioate isomerase
VTGAGESSPAASEHAGTLLDRLRACPTATLCDALIKTGLRRPERMLMEHLMPVIPETGIIAGRARTMLMGTVRDPERSAIVSNRRLAFDLVDNAGPDDFLVVGAPRGLPYAIWGGVLTLQASLRCAVGAVADGMTRDVADIRRLGFPVWARGVTPLPAGYGGYSCLATNVPVTCAGAEVLPGDYVVGDQDGVLVIPPDQAEQITLACETMEHAEVVAQEKLRSGSSMLDAYPSRGYYASQRDAAARQT